MLKFVIVGLIFVTVSAAPLESTPSEKSSDSHTPIELVRPSPINPDIPMDPKPPERIILAENEPERDRKSLNDKVPSDEHDDLGETLKSELRDSEPTSDNKHDNQLRIDQLSIKENRESDDPSKSTQKEFVKPTKSGEPVIVYAIKADEKQRSESFETSHRIPNVDEGERKFETSHHIPSHIEEERTKLIENAKIGQNH